MLMHARRQTKAAGQWWHASVIVAGAVLCGACTPRPHEVARAFCAAVAARQYAAAARLCAPAISAAVTNAPVAVDALRLGITQCDWQVHDLRWSDAGLLALVSFAVRHEGPPPPVLQGSALLHLRKQGTRWRIDTITMQFDQYTEFLPAPAQTNTGGHAGDALVRQPQTCAVQESLAAFMQRYDRYCRSFID
jgi:hypothetical protein